MPEDLVSGWTKRLIAAAFFVVFFIWAFFTAMHSPKPQNLPVAVVGTAQVFATVETVLKAQGDVLKARSYDTPQAANLAIIAREVYGAFVTTGVNNELVIAEANGPAIEHVLEENLEPVSRVMNRALVVTRVNPLPRSDKMNMAPFLLVFGFLISGLLAGIILSGYKGAINNRKAVALRVFGLAVYSLVVSGIAVLIMTLDFGVFKDVWFRILLAGALIIYTHGVLTMALRSLLGAVGILFGVAVLFLIGVPGSGGLLPIEFDASFWRGLGQCLPPYAGVTTIRNIAYFGANGLTQSRWVLGVFSVLGTLIAIGVPFREFYTRKAQAPKAPVQR